MKHTLIIFVILAWASVACAANITLSITVSDAELAALQRIATQRNTTVEAILSKEILERARARARQEIAAANVSRVDQFRALTPAVQQQLLDLTPPGP